MGNMMGNRMGNRIGRQHLGSSMDSIWTAGWAAFGQQDGQDLVSMTACAASHDNPNARTKHRFMEITKAFGGMGQGCRRQLGALKSFSKRYTAMSTHHKA